ncbi:MAG TPA: hypothetical protein VJ890_27510 [Vineibacter sp.]|nr:hypothetical protein [Vineibacter sp.]
MTAWQPPDDLRRLLDALGEEIAGAPDEDVVEAYRETGRSVQRTAREVRKLIAAACDGPDEPDPAVPLAESIRRREPCLRPQ